MPFIKIARRAEMPEEGKVKEIHAASRMFCVARVGGQYYALDNACLHWGGPLGLRYAARHPDRVARLVILNTGLMSGEAATLSPGLVKWREYALRTPDLPIGQIIKRSVVDRDRLSDAVVAAYDAPFPTPESKAGARAFPALIPTTPDAPGAAEIRETHAALASWKKPALVCFSDSDPVFPPAVGRALARLIPDARFSLIEGAGHFLQEEKGPEIAAEILDFVRDRQG